MRNLTPFSYLNVKFVCKKLNMATKNVDGSDIVLHQYNLLRSRPAGFLWLQTEYLQKRALFGKVMARIEADLCVKIKRSKLTCSDCGKRSGVALTGFCDEEFDQANRRRHCLECQKKAKVNALTSFHIRRKAYSLCEGCSSFKPQDLMVLKADVKTHFSGVLLARVLEEWKKRGTGANKICPTCYKSMTVKAVRRHVNEHTGLGD